jgi:hypothetical protein
MWKVVLLVTFIFSVLTGIFSECEKNECLTDLSSKYERGKSRKYIVGFSPGRFFETFIILMFVILTCCAIIIGCGGTTITKDVRTYSKTPIMYFDNFDRLGLYYVKHSESLESYSYYVKEGKVFTWKTINNDDGKIKISFDTDNKANAYEEIITTKEMQKQVPSEFELFIGVNVSDTTWEDSSENDEIEYILHVPKGSIQENQ